MFETNKEVKQKGELCIENFSFEAVKDFLNFLYTRIINNEDYATEMYDLASKYDVPELRAACEEIIVSDLDESNGFETYNFGHIHGCERIKRCGFMKVQDFIEHRLDDRFYEMPDRVKEIIDLMRK